MTDYGETFACGCPWQHQRAGYQYREVHSEACQARTRAHRREYGERMRARYAGQNTLFCTTGLITVEGEPPDDVHDLSDVDTVRPQHIPPVAVSLAAWRALETGQPGADHDLVADRRLALWWRHLRDSGLLPSDDA